MCIFYKTCWIITTRGLYFQEFSSIDNSITQAKKQISKLNISSEDHNLEPKVLNVEPKNEDSDDEFHDAGQSIINIGVTF